MSAYGCFTTVRVEVDGVRGWEEHVRRLVRDTTALFDRPVTEPEVRSAVRAALAGVERPVLLRVGVTAADHSLDRPGGTDLVVEATSRPVHGDLSALRVVTTPHRRALADLKHLGTMPELLARRRARAAGYDDALFVDGQAVTEGPTWSLVAQVGDDLVAPTGGLPSVTLSLLARVVPITVRELAVDALAEVTDAVALNAGWGVRPIAAIDGRPLAGAVAGTVSGGCAGRLAASYAAIEPDPL